MTEASAVSFTADDKLDSFERRITLHGAAFKVLDGRATSRYESSTVSH